ncbi:hypothetical protein GCM10010252_74660 [Streptomyces aureoverticillatus]|nr:hypothetical protein GCM10010252_74660 [Streptomyces aureoverticillatus]
MARLRGSGRQRMWRRAGVTATATALFLGLALSGGPPSQAATWGHFVNAPTGKCLTAFDNDVVNLAPCEAGRAIQLWNPQTISGEDLLIRNAAGGCLWARPLAGMVGAYRGDCDPNDAAKRFRLFGDWVFHARDLMTQTQAWGNQVVVFSGTVRLTDPSCHWFFRAQSS